MVAPGGKGAERAPPGGATRAVGGCGGVGVWLCRAVVP